MIGFVSGLTLGFGLIVAIGSQNAYVLKQGLKKEYIFIICLICSFSDAVLIILGVSGFSAIISTAPWIETVARYGGSMFLAYYGARSFLAVLRSESLHPSGDENKSLLKAISTCLAFTWLNPHVYLDTVVLIGSISSQFSGQIIEFTAGAVLASFLFFYSLGYGARVLSPIFINPKAWKVLDLVIGVVMWSIAFSLIRVDMMS